MVSRTTLIGALVVAELAIVGIAIRAIAGDAGPSRAFAWNSTSGATSGPRLDASFSAGPTPHVVMDLDDVGVVVQGSSSDTVHAVETLRVFGWAHFAPAPIVAVRTADGVRISVPNRHSLNIVMGGYEHTLTVTVPEHATLQIANADGSIRASGLRSALKASTADGSIHLSDLRGDVDVATSDGSITASDMQGGTLTMQTSDGRIRLDRIVADRLHVASSDGSIEARAVRIGDGELRTAGGSVRIGFAPDSDATVNLRTTDGRIHLDAGATIISSSADDDRDSQTRVVRLGSGRGRFDISSGDGSISLTQGGKV